MRVLSITAQKPNSTGSGIYLTALVQQWSRMGHEQAVVAGVYKEDQIQFPEGTVFYPVIYRTEKLPFAVAGMSDEMPYESLRYQDLTQEMAGQFAEAFHEVVDRAIEEFQPNLILCHHLYLLTARVRKWYPDQLILGVCHGSDIRQICKNVLFREEIKEQIRKLDGVIALQEKQKEEIQDLFGIEAKRVRAIGAGYNQDIFYRGEKQARTYAQLVFAGKVSEKKGVFSLLRALEYLPYAPEELQVKIAGGHGQEEEYEAIQELAKKSRYRIEFLGALPQMKLADVFRQSDVFVLPSYFEGLALVNIEAIACGLRVVCSDIPGIAEWFHKNIPGNGIAFVTLPGMRNMDEPRKEELDGFERRLAEAIQNQIEHAQKNPEQKLPDLSQVSWEGISHRILKFAEEIRGTQRKEHRRKRYVY